MTLVRGEKNEKKLKYDVDRPTNPSASFFNQDPSTDSCQQTIQPPWGIVHLVLVVLALVRSQYAATAPR